LQQQTLQRL